MEKKEKMKAARNEKSLVSVKSKVDFLDTEGNKSFFGEILQPNLEVKTYNSRSSRPSKCCKSMQVTLCVWKISM